ncbi:MAG: AEC family transporter [Lachnospiraceae bacterium]|nr:AEC family transporter [Lachnospiraceae bacterium]
MELSLLLMQQIIKLFIMIFMGYMIVKVGILKSEDSRVFSAMVLYLIVPCVIMNAFQVEYSPEKASGLFLAFVTSLLLMLVTLPAVNLLGRLLKLNEVERMSVYYSNAGNLIIPLVTFILGEEWVLYACVYMSIQTVFFWTHCKKELSREKRIDLKKIFTNINIIVVMIAVILFFMNIHLPKLLTETFESVSGMVGPASMFVIGMLMAGADLKKIFMNQRAYLVTGLRLIAVPVFSLLILKISRLVGNHAEGRQILLIVFLAVTTPAASTVTQMSQIYGNDSEYASAIGVMTTLAAVLTMPLMVLLFQLVI